MKFCTLTAETVAPAGMLVPLTFSPTTSWLTLLVVTTAEPLVPYKVVLLSVAVPPKVLEALPKTSAPLPLL